MNVPLHLLSDRLVMRELVLEDAEFIFDLYNTPSFKKFVGDKQLRTLFDAEAYLVDTLVAMYQIPGMGLLKVERKVDNVPIGLCGLIKRDSLNDIDLGFGFLPMWEGQGYAFESANEVLSFAKHVLGIDRVVAITLSNNTPCVRLLSRLGFSYECVQERVSDEVTLGLYGKAL